MNDKTVRSRGEKARNGLTNDIGSRFKLLKKAIKAIALHTLLPSIPNQNKLFNIGILMKNSTTKSIGILKAKDAQVTKYSSTFCRVSLLIAPAVAAKNAAKSENNIHILKYDSILKRVNWALVDEI
ncbi:MAG: hypothetical protein ABL917_00050 [Parcubacteria group bacterium]